MNHIEKYLGTTNFFLLAEAVFSFSVMTPKLQTNNTVGHELIMRFADPLDHELTQFSLFVASLMACIVCWLVDNYIGKCYAILSGLISLMVVNMLLVLSELRNSTFFTPNVSLTLLLMFYIATSPTRNVLILEQGFKKFGLRNIIVFLVIVRLITNAACRAEPLQIIGNRTMFKVLLALGINISYLLIFILLVPVLVYEPTYSCIWSQCLKCIGLSMARSSMQTTPNVATNSKPLELTEYWGFQLVKVKNEIRGLPSSNKRQNFMPWWLWLGNIFRKKQSDKDIHWLYLSAPDISNHVIEQTKKLITIFPFVILPFLISNIIHFVTVMTMNQAVFTLPLYIDSWPGKDVVVYSVLFDLLLFFLFEVVVYPIIHRFKLSDLHLIHCGWVFLIGALAVTFCVQSNLESSNEFLPARGKAQLRIYNAMDNDTIVSSQQFPDRLLESKNFLLQTGIPCHNDSKNFEIEVANQQLGSTKRFVLDLVEKQTVSYIVLYDKLKRNSKSYDPTIFSADFDQESAYFILIYEFLPEKFTFNLISRDSNKNYRLNKEQGVANKLEPGSYDLFIYDDYVEIKKLAGLSDDRIAANVRMIFSPGCLYGLFLYKEKIDEILVKVKIILLEGPLTRKFWILFIQLCLTSLGNAVVSVSYYRFLFFQSPNKLRVTMFTTAMILQFFGLAINRIILNFDNHIKTSTLILMYLTVHLIIFIASAFRAYFF